MSVKMIKRDGSYALHLFYTVDWKSWYQTTEAIRSEALDEFQQFMDKWDENEQEKAGSYGVFNIVGQKADILLMFLRPTMEELIQLENEWNHALLAQFINVSYSFVSIVEKSTFEKSKQMNGIDKRLKKDFHTVIPKDTYICFYPMSKDKNESNWYGISAEERRKLMMKHVQTVQAYNGKISRIVTGAVGLDDYEWGVSLFSSEPKLFKQMLYDSKFDEVHASYTTFGSFYIGQYIDKDVVNQYFISRLVVQ